MTLGPRAPPALVALPHAAPHVAPAAFQAMLLRAGQTPAEGATVLLDVRNVYETRVGAFAAPGVATVQPRTRAFADFPAWVDGADARAALAGARTVLMYCTGGVRCERASSYLRSAMDAWGGPQPPPEVLQLEGGITRYLHAFPSSSSKGEGLFRGVNFVFDERGCEGDAAPLGCCAACGGAAQGYRDRGRCPACRLLLLLCARCAAGDAPPPPLCELCCDGPRAPAAAAPRRRGRRRAPGPAALRAA